MRLLPSHLESALFYFSCLEIDFPPLSVGNFVPFGQKGNPLLKHIRNARWTYADIVPDYVLGQSSCALYIRFLTSPLSSFAPVSISVWQ